MVMAVEVRTAEESDREPMHQLGQHGFAVRATAYDEEVDRTGAPLDRRLVAVDGGRIVGKLAVWELGQWFGGSRVPMGGVAGVAVEAAHRGRGVASALLRAALAAMRERGEVLSTLYPMNHTLYRRHGWEVAGSFPQHRVDLRALGALPSPGQARILRRAERDDLPALRDIHQRMSRYEPGNLWYGDEFAFRRLLDHPGFQEAYVTEHDGAVTGAVTIAREETAEERGFYSLVIMSLVAVDLDTELALLHLLSNYHPVARTAELVAASHHALPMLLGERELHPAGKGWCWMSRLVDARAAVAARGYPHDVDVELHLDIADTSAPWNAGAHVLRVKAGQGSLEPGGRGDVQLSSGALASLYTGWANARRLAMVGMLPGAGEQNLVALDRAFGGRTPWARDFF
jgi:predicted acetyltransferase